MQRSPAASPWDMEPLPRFDKFAKQPSSAWEVRDGTLSDGSAPDGTPGEVSAQPHPFYPSKPTCVPQLLTSTPHCRARARSCFKNRALFSALEEAAAQYGGHQVSGTCSNREKKAD